MGVQSEYVCMREVKYVGMRNVRYVYMHEVSMYVRVVGGCNT